MESIRGITPHEFEILGERVDATGKELNLSSTILSHLFLVVGQCPASCLYKYGN